MRRNSQASGAERLCLQANLQVISRTSFQYFPNACRCRLHMHSDKCPLKCIKDVHMHTTSSLSPVHAEILKLLIERELGVLVATLPHPSLMGSQGSGSQNPEPLRLPQHFTAFCEESHLFCLSPVCHHFDEPYEKMK